MVKYVIKFSKEGDICYISHLDVLRLFKRAFKRAGIALSHSQGFNPHPKMSFAQPLSLGYSSVCEYLEFETNDDYEPADLHKKITAEMPEGISILECKTNNDKQTLAARTTAAEYLIGFPIDDLTDQESVVSSSQFLAQQEIIVEKRQKKKKDTVPIDIRDKIQLLDFLIVNNNLLITARLDSGSHSNLSPELLITAVIKFLKIEIPRHEIKVMRTKLLFS